MPPAANRSRPPRHGGHRRSVGVAEDVDANEGDRGTDDGVRVLTADDHPVVRTGISAMLANEPNLELAAEARDDAEAVALSAAWRSDVVLTEWVR